MPALYESPMAIHTSGRGGALVVVSFTTAPDPLVHAAMRTIIAMTAPVDRARMARRLRVMSSQRPAAGKVQKR
jgi:hypothetical protein